MQGSHPGLFHYLAYGFLPVDVGQDHPFLWGEADLRRVSSLHGGHLEYHVQVRDLLLDAVPFVQPPGTLHDQFLGADGKPDILLGKDHAGLKIEIAVRPAQHLEDGILDLLLDEDLQLFLSYIFQAYKQLTQALSSSGGFLEFKGFIDLGSGDDAGVHQFHSQ